MHITHRDKLKRMLKIGFASITNAVTVKNMTHSERYSIGI